MRAASIPSTCGASRSVAAVASPASQASAPTPAIAATGVVARGGIATCRASTKAAASLSPSSSRRNRSLVVSRAAVEGGSLSSVSLGPPSTSSASSASSASVGSGGSGSKVTAVLPLDKVDLTSDAGIDWTKLRDLLSSGDIRAADDEHRARLIELAGPGAVERGWVYFSEVKSMPSRDLRVMDALWRAVSGGKYGFSAQREVWLNSRKRWDKFFQAIDWVQGEDSVYRKWPGEFDYSVPQPGGSKPPKGHMPLTNALRGTQLFQAILEHPAWEEAPQGVEGKSGRKGPEWLSS